MFRTLRRRLIWSQIIPLIIVLPIMGLVLIYTLESQILIPKLANTLLGDARLLAEISSSEYELWGNPILFERLISRVQLDNAINVMFLDSNGNLLFTSDSTYPPNSAVPLNLAGTEAARNGNEKAYTTYSITQLKNVVIDVFEPVTDSSNSVIGIVRLTYRVESLYDTFGQMRWQIILAIIIGLLLSAVIGTILSLSISRPISQVTTAIYDLAIGQRHEPLEIKGPNELRFQAQAVNFLVEQLHNLEQSRRQLLANLVHELGRPLGAIRSAIHALENGADKDPILFSDLTRGIDAETVRLNRLLDDLANLYDQSVGDLEMNFQKVDIYQWLPVVLRPWQSAAMEKGITWQETIEANLPSITMDTDRMAQVVGNVISNAVKFTKSGGKIVVHAGLEKGDFQIKIKDTGIGIKPEEIKNIFHPFYRGGQGRRIIQGMGLGLTIANDLTHAHGGTLTVESVVAQGSTFTIKFPVIPEPKNAAGLPLDI
jgi:two-component system sensor histidine kinase BaeS